MQSTQFEMLATGAAALRRYARSRFNEEKVDVLSISWPDAAAVVEVAHQVERAIAGGTIQAPPHLTYEQQSVLRTVHWMSERREDIDATALEALVQALASTADHDVSAVTLRPEKEGDDEEEWLSGRFAARGHPLRRVRDGEADWVVHERTIREQRVLVFESWGIMRVVRQVPGDWRSLPDQELIGVAERR
jgi:hypothetical protein